MYRIIIYLVILASLVGCGDAVDNDIPVSEHRPEDVTNHWALPSSLGAPYSAVDFSGRMTLMADGRVDVVHKSMLPELCNNYVLWRVAHNGSCWVTSAMTQFIFTLIDGGPGEFDRVIKQLKTDVANTGADAQFKEFFDYFALVRQKMDFRDALDLLNHQNVHPVLDRGFRMLLAKDFRARGDFVEAAKIEKPGEWGYASHFKPLFNRLGLKYAGISTDGEFGESKPTTILHDLEDYFGNMPRTIDVNRRFGQAEENLPKVLFFRSSPGFMDIAVLKTFSDQINGH